MSWILQQHPRLQDQITPQSWLHLSITITIWRHHRQSRDMDTLGKAPAPQDQWEALDKSKPHTSNHPLTDILLRCIPITPNNNRATMITLQDQRRYQGRERPQEITTRMQPLHLQAERKMATMDLRMVAWVQVITVSVAAEAGPILQELMERAM